MRIFLNLEKARDVTRKRKKIGRGWMMKTVVSRNEFFCTVAIVIIVPVKRIYYFFVLFFFERIMGRDEVPCKQRIRNKKKEKNQSCNRKRASRVFEIRERGKKKTWLKMQIFFNPMPNWRKIDQGVGKLHENNQIYFIKNFSNFSTPWNFQELVVHKKKSLR